MHHHSPMGCQCPTPPLYQPPSPLRRLHHSTSTTALTTTNSSCPTQPQVRMCTQVMGSTRDSTISSSMAPSSMISTTSSTTIHSSSSSTMISSASSTMIRSSSSTMTRSSSSSTTISSTIHSSTTSSSTTSSTMHSNRTIPTRIGSKALSTHSAGAIGDCGTEIITGTSTIASVTTVGNCNGVATVVVVTAPLSATLYILKVITLDSTTATTIGATSYVVVPSYAQ
uniref:Uncharacterized protein n=1 Tax=Lygus hesperus TaxID=30085 RepID=A0A0A9XFS7_LYGHE